MDKEKKTLIIADSRIPDAAKEKLSEFGTYLPFSTSGITYPAISCHPDIFFRPVPGRLVVAPNLPEIYFSRLRAEGIDYIEGRTNVGGCYPQTVPYNAYADDEFLVHAVEFTDPVLLHLARGLRIIRVAQGYAGCNLLRFGHGDFITGDRGILKQLLKNGLKVHYLDHQAITLPGFMHGFIGGACSVFGNNLFICGSISRLPGRELFRRLAEDSDLEIIELYDGPPVDCGGILFL